MKVCRSFISVGSVGRFLGDPFLLAFKVPATLFQPLLSCRGALGSVGVLSVRCHSWGLVKAWEMHLKGLQSQRFTKGANRTERMEARRSLARGYTTWLNLLITIYRCFSNLISQEASFPFKDKFLFLSFFSFSTTFHTKYLTHTFSIILYPFPC